MRYKLKLQFQGEPPFIMPVNYQYELSICIDKLMHFGSEKFSIMLQNHGHFDKQKKFKFYNFSNLKIDDYDQKDNRLILENNNAELFISLFGDHKVKPLFTELFKDKEIRFGDKRNKVILKVKDIEELTMPDFNSPVNFRTLSPLIICQDENYDNIKKTKYLSPEDKNYENLFFKQLLSKYAECVKIGLANPFNSDFSKLKIGCKSKPVSRIVRVKNNDNNKTMSVKGYFLDFSISAPEELINLGYDTGFGELNNMGFGFCEVDQS